MSASVSAKLVAFFSLVVIQTGVALLLCAGVLRILHGV